MKYSRLFAVDPSLTCSGWALFDIHSEKLLGVGKLRSLPPKIPLAERFEDLQRRIRLLMDAIVLGECDVLVCEAPTSVRDPHAALKVEQVRCIFEALGRERLSVVPGRLNPRSVQTEIIGLKGRQLKRDIVKEQALRVALMLYGVDLADLGLARGLGDLKRHQDIVDALLIGRVSLSRIKRAVSAGLGLHSEFEVPPRISLRRCASS
jgi:Holliday junction resolvasome RuvABC endonuclease subunit